MTAPNAETVLVNEGGERLRKFLATPIDWTEDDSARVAFLVRMIPGWSGAQQYAFFKQLLGSGVREVLMLGVYRGRDLAFLLDIAARYHPGVFFRFTGIDKFDAGPCADWPQEHRGKSWEEAGYGKPPSATAALANTNALKGSNEVWIGKSDDLKWLQTCGKFYDAVYLDTSHDYGTVAAQIGSVGLVCHEETIICGDDFSNRGTWGVKRAVEEGFRAHQVLFDWLWISSRQLLKT